MNEIPVAVVGSEEVEVYTDDEQFHRQRRTGIGSSDMPKIVGLSPFGDARSVYIEKVAVMPAPPRPTEGPLVRGIELEPLIEEKLYQQIPSLRGSLVPATFFRHPEHAHLTDHPDRITVDGSEVYEFKSCVRSIWHRIQEEGLLPSWLVQGEHHCGVTGAEVVHYVVFCHEVWAPPLILSYDRNEKLWGSLVTLADDFWFNHVLRVEPPEPEKFTTIPMATGLTPLSTEEAVSLLALHNFRERAKTAQAEADMFRDDVTERFKPGKYEGIVAGGRIHATVFETNGRTSFQRNLLGIYGALDPLKVQTYLMGLDGLTKNFNDLDISTILHGLADCRLDLTQFESYGKPGKTIRVSLSEAEEEDTTTTEDT